MTVTNHYGYTVDSEEPTTGVFQNNHVDYLGDELCGSDAIGLDYEACLDSFLDEKISEIQKILDEVDGETMEASFQDIRDICELLENPQDQFECYENNTTLIGFIRTFKKDEAWYWLDTLKYGYKPDLDAEYSAIVGEIYTQVIRSRWLLRGALCSPCYPGQVDVDTKGDYLSYSFPPDIYEEGNEMRSRIFHQEEVDSGKKYRIFCVDQCGCDTFWSNEDGWVKEGYTLFNEAEKSAFTNLPKNCGPSCWQEVTT